MEMEKDINGSDKGIELGFVELLVALAREEGVLHRRWLELLPLLPQQLLPCAQLDVLQGYLCPLEVLLSPLFQLLVPVRLFAAVLGHFRLGMVAEYLGLVEFHPVVERGCPVDTLVPVLVGYDWKSSVGPCVGLLP